MARRTGQDPRRSLATLDLAHTSQDVQEVGGRERCAVYSRMGMSRDDEVGSLMLHWVRGERIHSLMLFSYLGRSMEKIGTMYCGRSLMLY